MKKTKEKIHTTKGIKKDVTRTKTKSRTQMVKGETRRIRSKALSQTRDKAE